MSPEQLPRVLENRRADDEIARRRHGLINDPAKMAAGRDSRATLSARQNTETLSEYIPRIFQVPRPINNSPRMQSLSLIPLKPQPDSLFPTRLGNMQNRTCREHLI